MIFALYRFFDLKDNLLYVGRSINPGRRFEKHSNTKPWWGDVARVTIDHFVTLEELANAERTAITTEHPTYNIRMNGSSRETHPVKNDDVEAVGLVGRWFHTWRPAGDAESEYVTRRGDRVVEWQGEVIDQADGFYLCQTYSWWDGCPYSQELVAASDMPGRFTFYRSHIEMIVALGCGETFSGRQCQRPAEYVATGLGLCAVCSKHAGFHSQVQPVVWIAGIASLGKKLRRDELLGMR